MIRWGRALLSVAATCNSAALTSLSLQKFVEATLLNPRSHLGWIMQVVAMNNLKCFYDIPDYIACCEFLCQTANILKPNCQRIWYEWGKVYLSFAKKTYNLSQLEIAAAKLLKAVSLSPLNFQVQKTLANCQFLLGVNRVDINLLKAAKSTAYNCMQLHPHSLAIQSLHGSIITEIGIYFEDEASIKKGLRISKKAITAGYRNVEAWQRLADSYLATGEISQSKKYFKKAINCYKLATAAQKGNSPTILMSLAEALMKFGLASENEKYIFQAKKKFEKIFSSRFFKNKQLNLDSKWLYQYGFTLDLLGEMTGSRKFFYKAVKIFQRLVEVDPKDLTFRHQYALSLYHLADCNARFDIYKCSLAQFQRAIAQDPHNCTLLLDFAIVLTETAILIEKEPEIGQSCQQLYRCAEKYFLKANALGNSYAVYHLAGLYAMQNNLEVSLQLLKKAHHLQSLPPIFDLLHDSWLSKLTSTSDFKTFIKSITLDEHSFD